MKKSDKVSKEGQKNRPLKKELIHPSKLDERTSTISFLEERLSLFLNVFESIADAYLIMDIEGNVLKMNMAAKTLFGYDIDKEPINVVGLIFKEDYDYAMESFSKLQIDGKFKDYEARVVTKNGDIKWIQINASVILNDQKLPIAAQGIIRDITRSKENIEIIENQKKQLATIIDNSNSGIVLSKVGKILMANKTMCDIFGYTEDEFAQLTVEDLTYQGDYSKSKNLLNKMYADGVDHFEMEKRYVGKNGNVFWGKTKVNAIRNSDGSIDYEVVLIENITTQREKKLIVDVINDVAQSLLGKLDVYEIGNEITSKIGAYLSTDDCVMYSVDNRKGTLEQVAAFGDKIDDSGGIVNKLVLNIGDGIAGDVARSGTPEIINDTSKDNRYIVDHIRRESEICVPIVVNNEVIGIIDAEYLTKNYFTAEHLSTLVTIANLVGLQFNNALQLREIESTTDKLIDSENWLSTIINSLDTGILLETENREVKNANQKLYEIFNIKEDPKEYIGADLKEIVENEGKYIYADPSAFLQDLNTLIENKRTVLGQELVLKDGRVLSRDYIPIFEGIVCKGHLWSFRDITFKKKQSDRLEMERQKYSNILENMNMGIIETDVKGNILFVNQSFVDISGYEKEELIGKKGNDLFIKEESQNEVKKAIENRKKGVSYSYEVQVENKLGETRHWLISGAPNYDENNNVIGTIGAHLDITELKKLELQKESLLNQLAVSNKELNDYAHVVSHDLKSPLRSISALISWLKEDYSSVIDEAGINNLKLIDNKIETMDSLIEGILSYSSVNDMSEPSKKVNLNNIINKIAKTIYIPENITVSIRKKLPVIFVNETKIQQLFQNLIVNAVNYIDKKEGLVEVDYEDLGKFYKFSISDNGIGIEKEYHEKIFEIFQSVNNKNTESTGIGLSIVKKIVSLYQGNIWLESEEGKGSTFHFTIKKQ